MVQKPAYFHLRSMVKQMESLLKPFFQDQDGWLVFLKRQLVSVLLALARFLQLELRPVLAGRTDAQAGLLQLASRVFHPAGQELEQVLAWQARWVKAVVWVLQEPLLFSSYPS